MPARSELIPWMRHHALPLQILADLATGETPSWDDLRELEDYTEREGSHPVIGHPPAALYTLGTSQGAKDVYCRASQAVKESRLRVLRVIRADRALLAGHPRHKPLLWVETELFFSWAEADGLEPPAGIMKALRSPRARTARKRHEELLLKRGWGRPVLFDGRNKRANTLRRSGDGWLSVFAGVEARLPDLVGIHYLALLIESRPEGCSVRELHRAAHPPDDCTAPQQERESSLVDQKYLRQIQTELTRLEEQLEHERDPANRSKVEGEIERIKEHVAQTTVMGRSRLFAGSAERMRKSVGKAISDALSAIAERNPQLAHHLKTCVKTPHGQQPRYLPEEPVDWRIDAKC